MSSTKFSKNSRQEFALSKKVPVVKDFGIGCTADQFECYECKEKAKYFVFDGRALCEQCTKKFIAYLEEN